MSLDISRLAGQMEAVSENAVARFREQADLAVLARRWLFEHAGEGEHLRHPARAIRGAAVPTGEALDAHFSLPDVPSVFTVIAADGSTIQPDPHAPVWYHLINIGSLVYRHGSGEAPLPHSETILGYTEADLYEDGQLVEGNLLDVRRDLAEITHLADLCSGQTEPAPILALVDGTLVLWVLEDRYQKWQPVKVAAYLDQLSRIQAKGAAIAAFTSRPRRSEVTRLLHLASVGGDTKRASEEPNPLERLPDRILFETLPAGARSALYGSPQAVNQQFYVSAGHGVQAFYVNLAQTDRPPVIARVEVPEWTAVDPQRLALVHAAIVAQARITGDYPYALVRADELAFITSQEREALERMVAAAMLRAGSLPAPSPKAYYKSLTRQGRRKHG
jgi:NurA domain